MEFNALFRILNLLVSAALFVGAVGHFIFPSFANILIGAYTAGFGVIVVITELGRYPGGEKVRQKVVENWRGWWTFGGRGSTYLLFGILNLSNKIFLATAGAIVGFAGVLYFVLSFVDSITYPGPAALANPKPMLDMSQPVLPTSSPTAPVNVQQPEQSHQSGSQQQHQYQQQQQQQQPQYGYGYDV